MSNSAAKLKRIAIIGLPNTGKSQVFNNLTGDYTIVANFPLTTIEVKTGKCKINDETYEIIDTPGLHCLYIHSEEELIVRNLLLLDRPDIILQCIDANRLKQSLTLTADLLEFGIPMVISLNSIDETTRKGIWIDSDKLSKELGVPVIESVAISNLGTQDLKNAITRASIGKLPTQYGTIIENGIAAISNSIPDEVESKRKLAILLLLRDPFLMDYFKKDFGDEIANALSNEVKSARRQFMGNISWLINNKRNKWITSVVEKVLKKQKIILKGVSKTVAHLSRHPVWGIPILLLILAVTYFLIVNVANYIAFWMNEVLWLPIESKINILVTNDFLNEFLIGDYGVLTMGISNAILTVLPILSVFFLLFSILEDVGYIPNLCVLARRVSAKVGFTGNAILPVTLAFGCKTMATLSTKSLQSKKEKFIAIYLIAFGIFALELRLKRD